MCRVEYEIISSTGDYAERYRYIHLFINASSDIISRVAGYALSLLDNRSYRRAIPAEDERRFFRPGIYHPLSTRRLFCRLIVYSSDVLLLAAEFIPKPAVARGGRTRCRFNRRRRRENDIAAQSSVSTSAAMPCCDARIRRVYPYYKQGSRTSPP